MTMSMRHRTLVAACAACALSAACGETPQRSTPSEPAPPSSEAAGPPAEEPPRAEVRPAVAPAPAPPVEPWAAPPRPDTRRALAHILEPDARIGAYVGLPTGWRNDDPSYLLFFPRKNIDPPAPAPNARALAMTLVEPGLGEVNRRRLLDRGVEPTGMRDPVWETWSEQTVGIGKLRATIARGTGASIAAKDGPRGAIAAIVDVPGAPALGFIGTWPRSEPAGEADIGEMLRALERCQVAVGRGCVAESERPR
jgi:hypothetical protein